MGAERAAAGSVADADAQLDEGLRQLEGALGSTKGRVRIGIRGGNRVTLGQKVIFEASSVQAGKLIILDINVNREVVMLYPNQFVVSGDIGRIAVAQHVTVPGPDYQAVLKKGFAPVNEPPSYLMRLIRQIETALKLSAKAGADGADELKRWGHAVVEYEIVR